MGAIPRLEDCKPGMKATGFTVIVAPVEALEKIGSIHIPVSAKDKNEIVEQRGRIVSVGPVAFDFADFKGSEPRIGHAVIYAKLAGFQTEGSDGRKYRILNDRDICAVLEEAE